MRGLLFLQLGVHLLYAIEELGEVAIIIQDIQANALRHRTAATCQVALCAILQFIFGNGARKVHIYYEVVHSS